MMGSYVAKAAAEAQSAAATALENIESKIEKCELKMEALSENTPAWIRIKKVLARLNKSFDELTKVE